MYDHDYPLASIFFITFLFICGIVMTNVVVAILLDRYLAAMDDNDQQDAQAKDKNFPTIYLEVDNHFRPIQTVSWSDWEQISGQLNTYPEATLEEQPVVNSPNTIFIEQWGVDDVSRWLKKIGYDDYISDFGADLINGMWLMKITEPDLRLFGMKHGRRKIFMQELYKLAMEQNERLEQIGKLKKMFDEYDENGNGLIDHDEFQSVWEKNFGEENPIDPQDIQETLDDLDTNHDGVIDFAEFVAATTLLQEMQKEQNANVIEYSISTSSFAEEGPSSQLETRQKKKRKANTGGAPTIGLSA